MESKQELLSQLKLYKNARFREREARLKSEELLEEKSRELYFTNQELIQKNEQLIKLNKDLEETTQKLKVKNEQLNQKNQSLREKDERLGLALQASQIGIWTWDCIHDNIDVDDNMPIIFGFRHKKEFPKHYMDSLKPIHPEDRERIDQEVKESLRKGKQFNTEYRIIWPDGSEHIIATRGLMYTDPKNNPVKLTGVCLDITEKEQAKKRLVQLAKELEVNNQKLAQSNERLQEFAYVASHDLQEPLRTISNFVQLLQKRYKNKLDQEANEFIYFIVSGTERMKALIEGLLAYSRVESQGKPLKKMDMQESLNWALANLHSVLKKKGAEISYDPLPQVKGDQTQLGQLCQNLIENALQYHDPFRAIEIQIGAVDQGKNWKFFVKDNGIGIDPQFHQRIFKIFQRLHPYEKYKGTGIGLAVCKRIVERHGGKIWVDSKLNEGATFYFTLPKSNRRTDDYAETKTTY